MNKKISLSYKDAGVDIEAGDALIEKIKPIAAKTRREGSLDGLGGFGALFEIPQGYKQPVLVSSTDGVGTKLKLAIDSGIHGSVGIDLVAMCVNDILAQGAEPLFFLDYYASGHLEVDTAQTIIEGIGEGCLQSNMALIGGETAEMPGMYRDGDYDLAGFCVGVVEKSKIITADKVKAGDVIIGLKSSGPHSNGYSLIRKIIDLNQSDILQDFNGASLAETLMTPTRIYVKPVLELFKQVDVHGLAHITGGGLPGNVNRVLAKGCGAQIDSTQWQWPEIFSWLMEKGNVELEEMYRAFNCGIGMTIMVDPSEAQKALDCLNANGEHAMIIGEVTTDAEQKIVIS